MLLKALLQKRGNEFVEFMTTSFFPSINCPPEASAPFMTALQEAPEYVFFAPVFLLATVVVGPIRKKKLTMRD